MVNRKIYYLIWIYFLSNLNLISVPFLEIQNKIKNYIEINIKSDLKKIIKAGKKNLYKKKNIKNLIGKDIKPEFPKKPHIVITNNFKKDLNELSNLLLNKIDKIIV